MQMIEIGSNNPFLLSGCASLGSNTPERLIIEWASEDLACLDSELGTGHDRGHELDGAAKKLTRAQDVRGVAAELVVNVWAPRRERAPASRLAALATALTWSASAGRSWASWHLLRGYSCDPQPRPRACS